MLSSRTEIRLEPAALSPKRPYDPKQGSASARTRANTIAIEMSWRMKYTTRPHRRFIA
jgi:hypothetical protein